jgi:hypothetical protein
MLVSDMLHGGARLRVDAMQFTQQPQPLGDESPAPQHGSRHALDG